MHFLKKFFKIVVIILIILLISFVGYRYYELKKSGKLDEVFAKTEDPYKSGVEAFASGETTTKAIDGVKKEKTEEKDSSESSEYVLEKKDYEGYYNKFNFDNVLLLYEGEQQSTGAKEALDVLIRDVDDTMYSKPMVVFENFSGLSSNTITYENLDEYRTVLNQAKNSMKNGTYTFTFGYVGFTTTVNKIIITKN